MIIILSLLVSIYFIFTLVLWIAWQNAKIFQNTQGKVKTTITVIVPVRNESSNIIALLEDLNQQSLDFKNFEVIVVDDASTDDTFSLVENYISKANYTLKIIPLPQKSKIVSSKKRAITLAVQKAQSELIVCTDGDCRVRERWLETIANFYQDKNAKFISGLVTFQSEDTFFKKLQTVEFASLVGTGASCMSLGFPNMCNGANLAYPKSVFEEVEGYKGVEHIASGDDEFLLHKIAKKHPKQVFFIKSQNIIVKTDSKESLQDFYHQRKRWGSKWQYYKDIKIKFLAFFIFAIHFGLLLALILAILGYYSWNLFLIQLGIKLSIEWLYLSSILIFLKKRKFIYFIPIVQAIYIFYIVFFSLIVSFGKNYYWKGRQVS